MSTPSEPESSSFPSIEVQLNLPTLSAAFSSPIAVPVRVSVRNTGKTCLTVLRWGSPLDPHANILGLFEIRHAESGEPVTLDTIKLSRKLPPSAKELVEIPPSSSVVVEVTLPRVPLVEGHRYTIQAKGRWHAIWAQRLSAVTPQHLENLSTAKRGEFSSPAVPIQQFEQ
ncbi:hypothetical protein P175DRAFT_0532640 [Aspergillus ochraceoroseus IBT 24754]|uniref:Uncharacterized protein n=2 Tax=Aspergillus ochraceoroseus TaxID=138278 RepID=A0A2T5LYB9_9EURO|nr:uncharacterized protein P175DRAFT_0532640 [Aspergillus ochraceoroseus IBT 24754]KKK20435.1 hypothetical protein AOCH_005490 [Aspergillus ochraceoroseus]PTU21259.1 hypothetical protein P175DRAFT_0532640 [Aspergillus ochraceoroseus IBT 24754]